MAFRPNVLAFLGVPLKVGKVFGHSFFELFESGLLVHFLLLLVFCFLCEQFQYNTNIGANQPNEANFTSIPANSSNKRLRRATSRLFLRAPENTGCPETTS